VVVAVAVAVTSSPPELFTLSLLNCRTKRCAVGTTVAGSVDAVVPHAVLPVNGDEPASHPLLPHAASKSASAIANIPLINLMKPAPAKSFIAVASQLNAQKSAHSPPWA
jgi:hypothetical protein